MGNSASNALRSLMNLGQQVSQNGGKPAIGGAIRGTGVTEASGDEASPAKGADSSSGFSQVDGVFVQADGDSENFATTYSTEGQVSAATADAIWNDISSGPQPGRYASVTGTNGERLPEAFGNPGFVSSLDSSGKNISVGNYGPPPSGFENSFGSFNNQYGINSDPAYNNQGLGWKQDFVNWWNGNNNNSGGYSGGGGGHVHYPHKPIAEPVNEREQYMNEVFEVQADNPGLQISLKSTNDSWKLQLRGDIRNEDLIKIVNGALERGYGIEDVMENGKVVWNITNIPPEDREQLQQLMNEVNNYNQLSQEEKEDVATMGLAKDTTGNTETQKGTDTSKTLLAAAKAVAPITTTIVEESAKALGKYMNPQEGEASSVTNPDAEKTSIDITNAPIPESNGQTQSYAQNYSVGRLGSEEFELGQQLNEPSSPSSPGPEPLASEDQAQTTQVAQAETEKVVEEDQQEETSAPEES